MAMVSYLLGTFYFHDLFMCTTESINFLILEDLWTLRFYLSILKSVSLWFNTNWDMRSKYNSWKIVNIIFYFILILMCINYSQIEFSKCICTSLFCFIIICSKIKGASFVCWDLFLLGWEQFIWKWSLWFSFKKCRSICSIKTLQARPVDYLTIKLQVLFTNHILLMW